MAFSGWRIFNLLFVSLAVSHAMLPSNSMLLYLTAHSLWLTRSSCEQSCLHSTIKLHYPNCSIISHYGECLNYNNKCPSNKVFAIAKFHKYESLCLCRTMFFPYRTPVKWIRNCTGQDSVCVVLDPCMTLAECAERRREGQRLRIDMKCLVGILEYDWGVIW